VACGWQLVCLGPGVKVIYSYMLHGQPIGPVFEAAQATCLLPPVARTYQPAADGCPHQHSCNYATIHMFWGGADSLALRLGMGRIHTTNVSAFAPLAHKWPLAACGSE
jgi:hypothetical protein